MRRFFGLLAVVFLMSLQSMAQLNVDEIMAAKVNLANEKLTEAEGVLQEYEQLSSEEIRKAIHASYQRNLELSLGAFMGVFINLVDIYQEMEQCSNVRCMLPYEVLINRLIILSREINQPNKKNKKSFSDLLNIGHGNGRLGSYQRLENNKPSKTNEDSFTDVSATEHDSNLLERYQNLLVSLKELDFHPPEQGRATFNDMSKNSRLVVKTLRESLERHTTYKRPFLKIRLYNNTLKCSTVFEVYTVMGGGFMSCISVQTGERYSASIGKVGAIVGTNFEEASTVVMIKSPRAITPTGTWVGVSAGIGLIAKVEGSVLMGKFASLAFIGGAQIGLSLPSASIMGIRFSKA